MSPAAKRRLNRIGWIIGVAIGTVVLATVVVTRAVKK